MVQKKIKIHSHTVVSSETMSFGAENQAVALHCEVLDSVLLEFIFFFRMSTRGSRFQKENRYHDVQPLIISKYNTMHRKKKKDVFTVCFL